MRKIILLILIIGILSLNNVLAIGISPGATTVGFEPGLKRDVDLEIINSEGKAMNVLIVVKGELSQYIILSENNLEFKAEEKRKSLRYALNLPEELEPGKYSSEIVAVESASQEGGEMKVGVSLAVISKLDVYVAYPDKYPELELEIGEAGVNETARFFIPVINRGNGKIEKAEVSVEIYSELNLVDKLEGEEFSLNALERKEIVLEWPANVESGRYRARVLLNYDSQEASLEKEFNVGSSVLEVVYIYVQDFQLGGIAKFNVILENKLGELKNVYFSMKVFDSEGGTLANFKSPTEDLVKGRSEIAGFWDTAKVQAGDYDAKLELKYEDKTIEKNLKLSVDENEIIVTGATGFAIVRGGSVNNKTILIGIIVFLIVVIGILLFVIKRIKKKNSVSIKRKKGIIKA